MVRNGREIEKGLRAGRRGVTAKSTRLRPEASADWAKNHGIKKRGVDSHHP